MLLSCDTGCVTSRSGLQVFVKNSDRHPNEPLRLNRFQTQSKATTVIGLHPGEQHGVEMGANSFGVCIGNEALFVGSGALKRLREHERDGEDEKVESRKTTKKATASSPTSATTRRDWFNSLLDPGEEMATGLTGMEICRLALEGSRSAREAFEVVVGLVDRHGQHANHGYPAEMPFTAYQNAFLIVDGSGEAFHVETVSRGWVMKRVGARDVGKDVHAHAISNALSIGPDWDDASPRLLRACSRAGLVADGARLDFSRVFADRVLGFAAQGCARACRLRTVLEALVAPAVERGDAEGAALGAMACLRDHGGRSTCSQGLFTLDVCMHSGPGPVRVCHTTGSLVSVLGGGGAAGGLHFATGTSTPCLSVFKPVFFHPAPVLTGATPLKAADVEGSLWWRHEVLARTAPPGLLARHTALAEEQAEFERRHVHQALTAASSSASRSVAAVEAAAWREGWDLLDRWIGVARGEHLGRGVLLPLPRPWESQRGAWNRTAQFPRGMLPTGPVSTTAWLLALLALGISWYLGSSALAACAAIALVLDGRRAARRHRDHFRSHPLVPARRAMDPVGPPRSPTDCDVVVVGAGLAGLTCARKLVGQGLRVTVVEARDRVGGRTLTEVDPATGLKCDAGAAWVGVTQTRVLELMCELGLEVERQVGNMPADGKSVLMFSGTRRTYTGAVPPIPSIVPFVPSLPALISSEFMIRALDREGMGTLCPAAPWLDPEAKRLDSMTLDSYGERFWTAGARMILKCAARTLICAEPREMSRLFFAHYISAARGVIPLTEQDRDGAQRFKLKEGTQEISVRLAQDLGREAKARVLLGSPVTEIRHEPGRVEVVVSPKGRKAETITARRVVMAVPPSLTPPVTPALPPARNRLAKSMPLGCIIKTNVFYTRPWWRDAGLSGLAMDTHGPAVVVLDTSAPSASGPFKLTLFVVADQARRLRELPVEERRGEVLAQIGVLFDNPKEAAAPLAYMEKDWEKEEWSGGCYVGLMGPGVLSQFGHALARPVGPIAFCGTETASQWVGYMDGAVASGERAADDVAQSFII
jgi:monoamine oxidase